jgi:hypothetical protein
VECSTTRCIDLLHGSLAITLVRRWIAVMIALALSACA